MRRVRSEIGGIVVAAGERAKVWFGPGSMTPMGDMARE